MHNVHKNYIDPVTDKKNQYFDSNYYTVPKVNMNDTFRGSIALNEII